MILKGKRKTKLYCGLFLLIMFFSSCSEVNSDKNGSVTFIITEETSRAITAQETGAAAASKSETPEFFIELSLDGGYKETKIFDIKQNESASVTFNEIPVETEVKAFAKIYEKPKICRYEGESEKIIIQEGENTLSLKLKKIESQEKDELDAEPETVSVKITLPENDQDDSDIKLYIHIERGATETAITPSGSVSLEDSDILKITADEGYTSYEWKLNGISQPATSNILTLDVSSLNLSDGEICEITLLAKKEAGGGTIYHSQTVQIKKE